MSGSRPVDLLVALTKEDSAATRVALSAAEFDVDALVRFAIQNQVAGYVHSQLSELAGTGPQVDDLLAGLQPRHERQVRRSESACRDLEELVDLFRRRGCDVLLLKGLYFAQRFYGGLDRRASWDIDLLVRFSDIERAQEILHGAGFRRTSGVLINERISARFAHGFDYERPRCKVDLHWTFSPHPAFHLDYEDLWKRADRCEVGQADVTVLPDDMTITANLLASFEDIQRGAFRMRSFVDLFKILQQLDWKVDWEVFFEDRRREGLERVCAAIARLFLETFDAAADFPGLATCLQSHEDAPTGPRVLPDLLGGSTLALRNKRWASSLYGLPRVRVFGWWLSSLPFRVAVHRPRRRSRATA